MHLARILSGSSLFTASRGDIYDYQRCPKIVSIRTFRNTRSRRVRPEPKEPREITPAIIGQVGETVTEVAFKGPLLGKLGRERGGVISERRLESLVFRELRSRIQRLPKNIQEDLRNLVKKSLSGLAKIKPEIEEAFGSLTVIGKGESRYGVLPTTGLPDYVALTPREKPVLIEVKNTSSENRSEDKFQAAFYNTLGKTVGVVVQHIRFTGENAQPEPKLVLEQDAETLIVYPRLGKWTRVDDTVDMDDDDIRDVWRAKELGILGKSPETDCERDCPHTRLEPQLPEAQLDEIGKPLPLIFAKGSVELGVDYDVAFTQTYVRRVSPSLMDVLWRLGDSRSRVQSAIVPRLQDFLQLSLGVDQSNARKLLQHFTEDRRNTRTWVNPDLIVKEMANDIEPWRKMLPRAVLERFSPTAQGFATRIYTLPRQSATVVDRAWKRWYASGSRLRHRNNRVGSL